MRTLGTAIVVLALLSTSAVADWSYYDKKDEMRGDVFTFAAATSDNKVNFEFPYEGGSNLSIVVRKRNDKLDAIMFSISKGQFTCGIRNCKGAVRFDKNGKPGTIEELTLALPQDYSHDVLFAVNENWFYKRLRSSDALTIELPFYQSGNLQFKFSLNRLDF